jgi:biotin transport system substrate-specific component
MRDMSGAATLPSTFVPLRLSDRTFVLKALAVMFGTLFLASASWIEVPMVPVPMNMQTFAVTLVGALYGWRLGTITVLAWLGEAMLGLPVLSGGAGGPAHFVGPTAGYLAAFPIAAMLVGFLAERGWTVGNMVRSFGVMLLGNALILALGASWLATLIGWEQAVVLGVTPFLMGAALKSGLAVGAVEASRRLGRTTSKQ